MPPEEVVWRIYATVVVLGMGLVSIIFSIPALATGFICLRADKNQRKNWYYNPTVWFIVGTLFFLLGALLLVFFFWSGMLSKLPT